MMEIEMTLPLDNDGFMRRECPNCEREFKWHQGPSDDTPADFVDPPTITCPLCGKSAAPDAWWTKEQLEYAERVAVGPMMEEMLGELSSEFRSNKFVQFEVSSEESEQPDPLVEPDDMVVIEPPCHPWERVKVAEDAASPFYCIVCGDNYAV